MVITNQTNDSRYVDHQPTINDADNNKPMIVCMVWLIVAYQQQLIVGNKQTNQRLLVPN